MHFTLHKNKCTDRLQHGGTRAGTRLKDILICLKHCSGGQEKTTSLGLNTNKPAQIQPQVTRKPNVWLGQDRKAVDSTPHSQHSSTAAFSDKAL